MVTLAAGGDDACERVGSETSDVCEWVFWARPLKAITTLPLRITVCSLFKR